MHAAASGERDASHRVGDVVVEAGEEPEPVLTGQVRPPSDAGAGNGDAAGLAAERLAFDDRDLEPALDQLVGRRQPSHPATEDDDLAAERARTKVAHACCRRLTMPAAASAALPPAGGAA